MVWITRLGLFGAAILALAIKVNESPGAMATPVPELVVPAPDQCRVPPRSLASVAQLIGTPSTDHEGGPIVVPAELPDGPPVDSTIFDAVASAERELLACENAGDALRTLAMYSDRYLVSIGPQDVSSLESIVPAEHLPPAERISLLGIWSARWLEDEKVGAFVTVGNRVDPDPAPGQTFFVVFALVDGRWLIDDMIGETIEGSVAQISGTPPTGWRPAAPAGIGIGDSAVVITVREVALREAPGDSAPTLKQVEVGAELEVFGPSVDAEGQRWRPVAARSSPAQIVEGYVPEDAIAVVVPPPSPSPAA